MLFSLSVHIKSEAPIDTTKQDKAYSPEILASSIELPTVISSV